MAPINQHPSSSTTKLLLIGVSGSGKTGALASLAEVGYKLRILDIDNGLDILKNYVTKPESPYVKRNPRIAENVSFVTLTDPTRNMGGVLVPARVTVWDRCMNLLYHWKDGDEDLGKIADWDSNTVLVIDSLSMLSAAALNKHLQMQGVIGKSRTQNEGRRDVGMAQNLLRQFFYTIYDSSLRCNIILTSHITFTNEMGERPTSPSSENLSPPPGKGYPSAIGRALSPDIPRWFNSTLHIDATVLGGKPVHRIYTKAHGTGENAIIMAKNPAPMNVKDEYPIETGLADYFKAVREAAKTDPTTAVVPPPIPVSA
jgi:hypothetical protein